MSVNSVGTGQNNDQFQIKTKPGNTDKNGNVTNAKTKQTVNIFAGYDGDKNETIDSKEKPNSIFDSKKQSLDTRLNGYNLTGNAATHEYAQSKMEAARNKVNDFANRINDYSFKVGKLVREIMVTESKDVDTQKQQIIDQGAAQLDSKVDTDATQKANKYISDIEKAYKSALDQISKELSTDNDSNVDSKNDDKARSDHNDDKLDHSDTQSVEVFSDYDGNTDEHVKYSEIDSSTFKYSGTTNFGLKANQDYGKFLDESSNYDVDANFDKKAAKFDAKVGSTKLKGDNTTDVQTAKGELNTKATREAESFNEKISLEVQKEKFEAIDKAIKASQKDTSKFDNYQNAKNKGDASPTDGNNTKPDATASQPKPQGAPPSTRKPGSSNPTNLSSAGDEFLSQFIGKGVDTLFDSFNDLINGGGKTNDNSGADGTGDSKDANNNSNKFSQYFKDVKDPFVAGFLADSKNNAIPIRGNGGKITGARVLVDGKWKDMSLAQLKLHAQKLQT